MSPWKNTPLTFLITGATSGFGLQIARLALAAGHTVIGTSRTPDAHPSLIQEFTSTGRGKLLPLDTNASTAASTLISSLKSQSVEIDVLVSNAGAARLGVAETFTEEEVREQMETNYFGPYRLMREVIPGMRERRKGMIVSVATGAGVDGRDGMGIYAGSKGAVDALLRVWAKELAPFGIRCLTIHLGAFDTNFTNASVHTGSVKQPADYDDQMVSKVVGSLKSTTFSPDGDHKKASSIIYEMIVGEGFGEGKEDERVMFLGRDMWQTMERVAGNTKHAMDTFGDICNNVYTEKS